jgi:hypothetical protein
MKRTIGRIVEVLTIAKRVGIVGGFIGIASALVSGSYFLYNSVYNSGSSNANLAARVANLEDQVHILVGREDKGSADIGEIWQHIRVIESELNTISLGLADLKAQAHGLNEKTNEALSIASRKPPTVINPIQQRCADLAEEADTGQKKGSYGYSPQEVRDTAMNLMRSLNCGTVQH